MNKRSISKLLSIFCTAALLVSTFFLTSGCSGENNDPIRITAGVQTSSGISTLNPFWAQRFPNTQFVGLIMEPLVLMLEDGNIESCLAESWSVDATGKIWTVNLNTKAKWSDGTKVAADDVVFTFKQHYENAGEWSQGRANKSLMIDADDDGETDTGAIAKVDSKTVTFTLRETWAEAVFLNSLATVFICPKHIWEPKIAALEAADSSIEQYALEEGSAATIAAELIGSGPFVFKEYVPLQYVLYETDVNYWRGTRAIVDEVMLKMYATSDIAALALKSGEIDCLAPLETPQEVAQLLQNPNVKVDITTNYNHNIMFYLNMRYPPLNILEVRQAIDMALNKQDLITFAAFGYATLPQQIPFAPDLKESNPDIAWTETYVDGSGNFLPLATRIANANALLDAVPGMSQTPVAVDGVIPAFTRTWTSPDYDVDPFELSFEGLYLSSPAYQRATELIAAQMAKIGIEIIPTVETGAFGPKVFSGKRVFDHQTIIFGYPADPKFDGYVVKQWASQVCFASCEAGVVGWRNNPTETPPGTESGPRQTYDTPYDTPTAAEEALWLSIYNQMVEESDPLTDAIHETRFMIDPDERLAAILLAQQMFAEKLPMITLYHPNYLSAYSTEHFTGWENPGGVYYYGFSPPTISVKTLMAVKPIEN